VDVSTRIVAGVRTLPRVKERSRLLPVDWLRGLVMVLMTVDHASSAFNAGRLVTDAPALYRPGSALPAAQFWTRWITHLCAPTFVFLAGYVLFLSVRRRRQSGASEGSTTRYIVTRGLFIAALDPLWMVWAHGPHLVLQVLYAIGMSFVALAFLRRLPPLLLGALGLALLVLEEALAASLSSLGGVGRIVATLTLVPGEIGPFRVLYPLLPWLAMMLLGWAAAEISRREPEQFAGRLLLAGLAALAVFAVVRGLNGYGNGGLLRGDDSVVQWLHTAKYPPSLAYAACELGLAWLLLAALWNAHLPRWASAVLTPLGQSALFFYLLHKHLLQLLSYLLELHHQAGLTATYLMAALTIALLLPLCRSFHRYKLAHPEGWARWI
jgi:uncharacterized membrane protein